MLHRGSRNVNTTLYLGPITFYVGTFHRYQNRCFFFVRKYTSPGYRSKYFVVSSAKHKLQLLPISDPERKRVLPLIGVVWRQDGPFFSGSRSRCFFLLLFMYIICPTLIIFTRSMDHVYGHRRIIAATVDCPRGDWCALDGCTGRCCTKTKLTAIGAEYLGVLAAAGARYEGSRRRFHRDSFLRITCVLWYSMQEGRGRCTRVNCRECDSLWY